MHEARLWRPLKEGKVQCRLCSHYCLVEDGKRGICGVRENRGGTLYTLVYDRVAAINLDPIEKKPLYHFLPGTTSFSIGTMGCNLRCKFCQNYTLSQTPRTTGEVKGEIVTPLQIVNGALGMKAATIAYTYSEPTIFFELMQDTARLAVEKGLKNVLVSNGFMSSECLEELKPVIHAANIDLKAFTEDFYRDIAGAKLKPVLDNLKRIKEMGWWLEVTTLVIPGLNDSEEELGNIARFIADELSIDTPWHVSRFHPTYQLTDRGPTPLESINRALEQGKKAGLKFVYPGNVPGHENDTTKCPECGAALIERSGFFVSLNEVKDGACPECGAKISGFGLDAPQRGK